MKLEPVACKVCRKPFEPWKPTQKYCSQTCAGKDCHAHRRLRLEADRICLNGDCGKEFRPWKKTQKYCSWPCAMAAAAAKRPPKIIKERPLSADYISRKAVVRDAYALLKEIPPDTRTPGQVMMGEPIPGRSALDRRKLMERGQ